MVRVRPQGEAQALEGKGGKGRVSVQGANTGHPQAQAVGAVAWKQAGKFAGREPEFYHTRPATHKAPLPCPAHMQVEEVQSRAQRALGCERRGLTLDSAREPRPGTLGLCEPEEPCRCWGSG